MTAQNVRCRSNMRYPFKRKHALALFAMLLFLCALWMLREEDELSKELSTSSVQEAQVNVMYPLGEGQYRKEQQRIVLEQQQHSFEDTAPVEMKRGNYRTEAATTGEEPKKEQVMPPGDGRDPPRQKKTGVSKKVEKLEEKRARAKKAWDEIPEIPELSPDELEEFETRMKEYCNPPWVPVSGEEGQVNGDYELRYVHVIARHGDRTPMTQLNLPNVTADADFNCNLETARKRLPSSTLLSHFLASVMAQEEALGGWPQMPWFLRQLPVGASARRCGVAQLTPVGWLQHMKLGERLRQAYTDRLVPHQAYFRNPNMTRFKSTINARTQQSAFAFMFGFLPRLELRHGEWLKPADSFLFCPADRHCSCPAYAALEQAKQQLYFAKHKNSTEVQQVQKSVAGLLMKEPKVKSLPGITGQQELYSALTCHEKSLPCGPNGCVAQKHLAKIVAYTERVARQLRSDERGPHQKLARLSMHPLLTEIASLMKKISRGASHHPRFAFYSGHDVTMTPLLDALGLGEYRWPPYASTVILELWSKAGRFFLRALYNGRDKTSAVRFCRRNLNEDGLCPLHFFLKFVNKDNMAFFHTDSFEKACKLKF